MPSNDRDRPDATVMRNRVALSRRTVLAGAAASAGAALVRPLPSLAALAAQSVPIMAYGASGPTIEDAFRIRAPESYGHGVLDDTVSRTHFSRLGAIIATMGDLDPAHRWRWTPTDLVTDEALRMAVRGAFERDAELMEWCRLERASTRIGDLVAWGGLQREYDALPRPPLNRSRFQPCESHDPLGKANVVAAAVCRKRWRQLLERPVRSGRALATLLIALDLPVPGDLRDALLPDLAREIAATVRGEEDSGYGAWTVRTGCLRAFGALIDRDARHPLAHHFAHPAPPGPIDASGKALWAHGDDRDLDGFLLTPIGRLGDASADAPLPPMSARCALYGKTRPSEPLPRATLVVHHRGVPHPCELFDDRAQMIGLLDAEAAPPDTDPPGHTLIAIEGGPTRVWGPPLDATTDARVAAFVESHRAALMDHWYGRTDSLEMLEAVKAAEAVRLVQQPTEQPLP